MKPSADAEAGADERPGTRRHLVLLADGLVADPLSYYLELVPTAGALAVEAATMPSLRPVAADGGGLRLDRGAGGLYGR